MDLIGKNRKTAPIFAVISLLVLSACAVKPTPLSDDDFSAFASKQALKSAEMQEPIARPISLYEAMARAIKYNLDQQIEIKQRSLDYESLRLSRYDMLPTFVTSSGYNRRSNYAGGVSRSLITGSRSLEASTSSDRGVLNGNMDLSWSILDFGLSYYRSKQASDKVLIADEQRRKVINGVIEDVRTAYWRAYAAQSLASSLVSLEKEAGNAMRNSRALQAREFASPLETLTYQRELADIQREIDNIHGDLKVAKAQLGALINIPPGVSFKLVNHKQNMLKRGLPNDKQALVEMALTKRPEMRELAYRERINEQELKVAVLQVLPDFRLNLTGDISSNSFLFNGDWVSFAAKTSWNLLGLIRHKQNKKRINAQQELIYARAQAVALAIAVQIHVSDVRYKHAKKMYGRATRDLDIQRKIQHQMTREAEVGIGNEQNVIREKMNTLVARMRVHVARASLENAIANLYASTGQDLVDIELTGDESLKETQRIVSEKWSGNAG